MAKDRLFSALKPSNETVTPFRYSNEVVSGSMA